MTEDYERDGRKFGDVGRHLEITKASGRLFATINNLAKSSEHPVYLNKVRDFRNVVEPTSNPDVGALPFYARLDTSKYAFKYACVLAKLSIAVQVYWKLVKAFSPEDFKYFDSLLEELNEYAIRGLQQFVIVGEPCKYHLVKRGRKCQSCRAYMPFYRTCKFCQRCQGDIVREPATEDSFDDWVNGGPQGVNSDGDSEDTGDDD